MSEVLGAERNWSRLQRVAGRGWPLILALLGTVCFLAGCTDKDADDTSATATQQSRLFASRPFAIEIEAFDTGWSVDHRAPMLDLAGGPSQSDEPACVAYVAALTEADRFRAAESDGRAQRKYVQEPGPGGYFWLVAIRFGDDDSAAEYVSLIVSALESPERQACDEVPLGGTANISSVSRPAAAESVGAHSAGQTVAVVDSRGTLVVENEQYVWAEGNVAWMVWTSQLAHEYDPSQVARFVQLAQEAWITPSD